jgi:hypothetical protein
MQTQPEIEIDPDAPYGRKKNGQPYKTPQNIRESVKKCNSKNKQKILEYSRKYYADNTDKCRQTVYKWREEHPDKVQQYKQKHYYDKKAEFELYRELFKKSIETII